MTIAFEDRSLSCRECGSAFVWSAGEQEFYQQKGLLHEPQRERLDETTNCDGRVSRVGCVRR